jgi:23S rRNA-/tRNA-specific pseudouridylate synthase
MADLITFPPGVLDPGPVRLPILARGDSWFALDKPAGLILTPDAFHAEDAPTVVSAIHAAALAGKPQLVALGITGCSRIHALDAELSGAVVLASAEKSAAAMRNEIGSGKWEFVYDLVTEAYEGPEEISCDLPLLRHGRLPRMVVSHQAGKRCQTRFNLVRRLGAYVLWEVRTVENRAHQVRVHAAESGLRIVGEFLYVRVRQVYLSAIKRGYRPGREDERPLHPGLALHLRKVQSGSEGAFAVSVASKRPKTLSTLIKRLEDLG